MERTRQNDVNVEPTDPSALRVDDSEFFDVVPITPDFGNDPHSFGDIKASAPKINRITAGAKVSSTFHKC